jgi:S-adenosylmethionine:tRNA ribosyltransferase-isomerase
VIAAAAPIQRRADARLMVIDRCGAVSHHARRRFVEFVRAGDVVIANDAATLPASLGGEHVPTGAPIEVRLAARDSLAPGRIARWTAVVFGAGDFQVPTEQRPQPPALRSGDALRLGPLHARIVRKLGHPRLVEIRFEDPVAQTWAGLARHGRPIQYAYLGQPLAIWDTWTRIAGPPVAFEAPSAGFLLDWAVIRRLRSRGASFATVTLAAGISSTGDAELDRRLPFDEAYDIPRTTVRAIGDARSRGGRVIAVGTSVVRAVEHAADVDGTVAAGPGVATQRIGPRTQLRVIDAIVSGTHERGSSHYELRRAFQADEALRRMEREADERQYTTHEYGDSVLMFRAEPCAQAGRSIGVGVGAGDAAAITVSGPLRSPAQVTNSSPSRPGDTATGSSDIA